jgi:hypothetical protein
MGAISLQRVPAERDALAGVTAAAGGCCCCCCCCLHTLGGIIGAASARAPKPPEAALEAPIAVVGAKTAEPRYSIGKVYWLTLLLLCAIGAPIVLVQAGAKAEAVELFWFYALLLPFIQLATSLIILIMEFAVTRRPGRDERLRHLGSITLRAFIGGLIGIGVMVVIGVAL